MASVRGFGRGEVHSWPVRAWLERVVPSGPPITLPDGSGVLVFGSSSKATLVFDDEGVAARHCELTFEEGFWRVRDLGTEGGTRVNGHQVRSMALFAGDLLSFGRHTSLRFDTDLPKDDPALIAAIARDPELEAPWLVYADQLQEHGDPLGDRMLRARSSGKLDHQPWMGPLWEPLVQGALEIDWHLGFIRRAVVRTVAGRLPIDWRETLATLFALRVGRFIRELAVDVPRLDEVPLPRIPESLDAAQRWLLAQPSTPSSLRALQLGYHLTGSATRGELQVLDELALRLPRLSGTSVYATGTAGRLRALSLADGMRLFGLDGDERDLVGVVRLRREGRANLHLESPPGIPFFADGNPCYFATDDGRVELVAGRMRGEVRVNKRVESLFHLLPGDLVEVQAAATFRFEVA
jgi:uncharacterized protein (TIGR02996 family)